MSTKPVIFISYSHKDEPDKPRDGEVAWLSFVRTYLQPAVKHGVFDLWDDRSLEGGADWDPEIEHKLRDCDIFILLVSPHAMASNYIVDREIAIIRERQANGEDVHFYPLLLTPTPRARLDKVRDKNLRPRDAKPFSGFSPHDRMQHMSDAADEIAVIAARIDERKSKAAPVLTRTQPAYVHITGLPETPYERLVGRDGELQRLDDAWADPKTAILSLIAEGGAGKSALVNEWLKRMQAGNYRGADAVLGWSFYSQGTKERATSADQFLNWALEKLGIKLETTSATAKGDALADVLIDRRVLLVLDGVEPLQHGPDSQMGQLKDQGLRALLRRFAAASSREPHGLIVLTSRLAITDIDRWKGGAARLVDVEELSDAAGAELLRDNGVWGTDKELRKASHDFGGHPLALALLASFLKETRKGDIRKRDRIRELLADKENQRHDHAIRVMESYEKEWLSGQPVLLAIMHIIGLFDRPASSDCLDALRKKPLIEGLTDKVVELDDAKWQRAITRLREVRLLLPVDTVVPDALDAHPLVREWFGARLKATNESAWKAAHEKLFEHLRGTTKEGDAPTLAQLAPLYQAIVHGCQAGLYEQVLEDVYISRICRKNIYGQTIFYSRHQLGAVASDLGAISGFFEKPYSLPIAKLPESAGSWILGDAAYCLRSLGRLSEAISARHSALVTREKTHDWANAAGEALNLSEEELFIGNVPSAIQVGRASVSFADRFGDTFLKLVARATYAQALFAGGICYEAEQTFDESERLQRERRNHEPILYSIRGYQYCDLLLSKGEWANVQERCLEIIATEQRTDTLLDRALVRLALSRVRLWRVLAESGSMCGVLCEVTIDSFDLVLNRLRLAAQMPYIPVGLLTHAGFRRGMGDWDGTCRDLDEIEEIAGLGPMRLYLCDLALERARLAFARIEAFAPLNALIDGSPPKPEVPSTEKQRELRDEAAVQIKIAADYISSCGYHRRDAELAELRAVLNNERTFASLPIHV